MPQLSGRDPPPARAAVGDTVVARALFDQGKKAFSARKYEESVALFQKAWAEDPDLIEAISWKAQALDKAKDGPRALVAYREYVALADRKKAGRGTSPEEERLKAAAAKRIDALAVSEKEFRALEAKYVSDLAAAMRSLLARNLPAAALEAAERILEVLPSHEEALAARKRLSAGGGTADAGPFAAISSWNDILGEKLFPASESVVYGDGIVTLDVKNSGRLRPRPGIRFDSAFGFDTEFRVVTPYAKEWEVGLFFGETPEGYFVLRLRPTRVTLLYGAQRETPTILGDAALVELDPAARHSLGLVSRGNVLEAWLDGKRLLEVAFLQRPDASGEIGVLQAGSRVEWRRFRAGGLP